MKAFCAIVALVLACFQAAQGTKWAVLVAGSNGYDNYRHQVSYILSMLFIGTTFHLMQVRSMHWYGK